MGRGVRGQCRQPSLARAAIAWPSASNVCPCPRSPASLHHTQSCSLPPLLPPLASCRLCCRWEPLRRLLPPLPLLLSLQGTPGLLCRTWARIQSGRSTAPAAGSSERCARLSGSSRRGGWQSKQELTGRITYCLLSQMCAPGYASHHIPGPAQAASHLQEQPAPTKQRQQHRSIRSSCPKQATSGRW